MTAPAPANYASHALLSFGGKLTVSTGVTEIWNCNVRCASYSGGVAGFPADCDASLAVIVPKLQAFYAATVGTSTGTVGLITSSTLEWVKLNNIAPSGKYASTSVVHQTLLTPVAGALGASIPWVCTSAISWTTGATRGPGSHGRVYLPVAVGGNGGVPTIPAAQLPNIATLGKNLLNCVSNGTTGGAGFLTPVVASRKGAIQPITGVRVGSVIDIQRRRKDKLVETYTAIAYP